MKNLIISVIALFVLLFFQTSVSNSNSKFDPKLKFNSGKNYSREILKRDYERALKSRGNTAELVGISIDFQLGYNSTKASGENKASEDIGSNPKGGFMTSALLNVNLFNLLNLSTGLDFSKKKYEMLIPFVDPLKAGDSIAETFTNNYINIPMNANFGGKVSDKVGLYLSAGPYVGFLLSPDNAINGFKDFDLGLNGIITAKYFLNPFVAVLLGTKLQYGGLNNLLAAGSVSKLNLTNWGAFTGVSVGIGY